MSWTCEEYSEFIDTRVNLKTHQTLLAEIGKGSGSRIWEKELAQQYGCLNAT